MRVAPPRLNAGTSPASWLVSHTRSCAYDNRTGRPAGAGGIRTAGADPEPLPDNSFANSSRLTADSVSLIPPCSLS
jgi:hypothetical protein